MSTGNDKRKLRRDLIVLRLQLCREGPDRCLLPRLPGCVHREVVLPVDVAGEIAQATRRNFERHPWMGGAMSPRPSTIPGPNALRHVDQFAHASAWQWSGDAARPVMLQEPLEFVYVKMAQRSYK